MKCTDTNNEPVEMTFLSYEIHRNDKEQIQFDEELDLKKLNAKWEEGDILRLSIEDGRVTLTKL